jgi:hypothetical protein
MMPCAPAVLGTIRNCSRNYELGIRDHLRETGTIRTGSPSLGSDTGIPSRVANDRANDRNQFIGFITQCAIRKSEEFELSGFAIANSSTHS